MYAYTILPSTIIKFIRKKMLPKMRWTLENHSRQMPWKGAWQLSHIYMWATKLSSGPSSNNVHTYDVSNKQNDGIEFRVYVESKENSFKRQKAEHYRCIM